MNQKDGPENFFASNGKFSTRKLWGHRQPRTNRLQKYLACELAGSDCFCSSLPATAGQKQMERWAGMNAVLRRVAARSGGVDE
jgi:hypothetical protein